MADESEPIELTITFDPTADGAGLRWQAAVLGVRESRFVTPLPGPTLDLVLHALDVLQDPSYPSALTAVQHRHFSFGPEEQAILRRLSLWSNEGSVPDTAPRQVGRALYRALVADPAGAQAFGTVRDHAFALGRPLSLSLCFPPDAVALAALPWELLWDEGPAPLLLSRGTSACARHLSLAQALPPPRLARGPLRILAIAPRAGIPSELRCIERAARLSAWKPLLDGGHAQMREVNPADRLALLSAMAVDPPPDIVHFYGHGRYQDGQGALLLDGAGGAGSWTSAATLAALFGGVGLVVIHACQGAAAGTGSLLTGVAPALSAAGVPVVVAMQLSVRSDAATQISAAIYTALAQGSSVQQAVAEARRTTFVAEDDQVSWFVPVLYLRSRETGPVYLRRPEPLAPGAATPALSTTLDRGTPLSTQAAPLASSGGYGPMQAIVARGGVIQRLWMRGGRNALQHVRAENGGAISDVVVDGSTPRQ